MVSNKEKDLGHVLFKHLTLSFIRFHSHEGNVDNFISTALTTLTRHRRHTKTLCIAGASHQGRSSTFVCLGGLVGRTGRTSMPIPSMIGTYPLFPSGRLHQSNHDRNKAFVAGAAASSLCPAVPRRTVQYHRHTNHVLLLYRESQQLACNSNARQNER